MNGVEPLRGRSILAPGRCRRSESPPCRGRQRRVGVASDLPVPSRVQRRESIARVAYILLEGRKPVPQFAQFGRLNPLNLIECACGHFNPNSTILTDLLYGSSGSRKGVGSEGAGVNEVHLAGLSPNLRMTLIRRQIAPPAERYPAISVAFHPAVFRTGRHCTWRPERGPTHIGGLGVRQPSDGGNARFGPD